MTRPLLLDLFCGAGGAAMGYHRAGFDIVGVDIDPQPRYPFPWHRADWLDGLANLAGQVDAVHASPPCQAWSAMNTAVRGDQPQLIDAVRAALTVTGRPYVIENVERAPLRDTVTLCGTQFGLNCRRHRRFEVHPPIFALIHPCWCHGRVANGELLGHRLAGRVAEGRRLPPLRQDSERPAAYGVEWMTARQARQAIPPAYTEWIGRQLIEAI